MPFGAQHGGQVAGQGSDIDALARPHGDLDVVGVRRVRDRGLVDHDLAGLQLELHAVAGQIIGALAVDADGRELGRRLVDLADEGRQGRPDRLDRGPHVGAAGDLALAVDAVGGNAPVDGEAIDLLGVHHEGHRLGRLTQRNGQDARSQRVQRPGVTRLLGVEQTANLGHRLGRAHLERLVEADPAVDDLALLAARHQSSPDPAAPSSGSSEHARSARMRGSAISRSI
ncbi:hypothetical protein D3C72_1637640 [compost metagenome]